MQNVTEHMCCAAVCSVLWCTTFWWDLKNYRWKHTLPLLATIIRTIWLELRNKLRLACINLACLCRWISFLKCRLKGKWRWVSVLSTNRPGRRCWHRLTFLRPCHWLAGGWWSSAGKFFVGMLPYWHTLARNFLYSLIKWESSLFV